MVKVYRTALGRSLPILLDQVVALRGRHRLVCGWYAGTSVAVPVEYLVLHGPLLDQPAAAGIQPYVAGEKWDVFELLQSGRLAALLEEHAPLRAEFRLFVERTVAAMEAEDRCLDLIGKDNLLVVRHQDELQLRVIDYGVVDLKREREHRPHRAAVAVGRVAGLVRLYEALDGVAAPADLAGQGRE